MRNHWLNPCLLVGLIGFFTCGSNFTINLFQAFQGPRDIWWTLSSQRLPLSAGREHHQVFIKGQRLEQLLADQRLLLRADDSHNRPLGETDFSLRLNNWPQVQARYLGFAVFSGTFFGMSLAFLIAGLVRFFQRRRPPAARPSL